MPIVNPVPVRARRRPLRRAMPKSASLAEPSSSAAGRSPASRRDGRPRGRGRGPGRRPGRRRARRHGRDRAGRRRAPSARLPPSHRSSTRNGSAVVLAVVEQGDDRRVVERLEGVELPLEAPQVVGLDRPEQLDGDRRAGLGVDGVVDVGHGAPAQAGAKAPPAGDELVGSGRLDPRRPTRSRPSPNASVRFQGWLPKRSRWTTSPTGLRVVGP